MSRVNICSVMKNIFNKWEILLRKNFRLTLSQIPSYFRYHDNLVKQINKNLYKR